MVKRTPLKSVQTASPNATHLTTRRQSRKRGLAGSDRVSRSSEDSEGALAAVRRRRARGEAAPRILDLIVFPRGPKIGILELTCSATPNGFF